MSDMRKKEKISDEEFADRLEDIIISFIKTAQVPSGQSFTGTSSVGAITGTTTTPMNLI